MTRELRVPLVMGDSMKGVRRRTKAGGAEAGAAKARSSTVLVAFRVPSAVADRLDALAARLSTPWHEMKRSELARVAMEHGLEALEQETADQRRDE